MMMNANRNTLFVLATVALLAATTGCNVRNVGENNRFASTEGSACTVCHGNNENAAPPKAVTRQNGQINIYAVGAHQAHLRSTISLVSCNECHFVPKNRQDHPGPNAEGYSIVTFGRLATADGANPVWDRSTGTCGTVYCHGSTLASSMHFNPNWNTTTMTSKASMIVKSKAAADQLTIQRCTTCHANPHPDTANCTSCHAGTHKTFADRQ